MAKDFKVAVIGCGHWGKNHVRTFHELGALAAISDPNEAAASALSEKFSAPVRAPEEIFADAAIDGVVIAAPAELHAPLALDAFAAGKHVFVEKPVAVRVEDAEAMARAAEDADRTLMVGHLLQYHPVFEALRALVMDGELGRLRYVYSNRLNMGKLRTEEDALWSFAPHDISMVLSLVGEDPSDVDCVDASFLTKGVADISHVHLSFPSGARGHVFASWLNPFKEQKLTVVGEKAMAVFDDCAPWEQKLAIYRHGVEIRDGAPVAVKADAEFAAVEQDEPLKRECRHFIESAASGARPRTDAKEALSVLKVLQRAGSPQ